MENTKLGEGEALQTPKYVCVIVQAWLFISLGHSAESALVLLMICSVLCVRG